MLQSVHGETEAAIDADTMDFTDPLVSFNPIATLVALGSVLCSWAGMNHKNGMVSLWSAGSSPQLAVYLTAQHRSQQKTASWEWRELVSNLCRVGVRNGQVLARRRWLRRSSASKRASQPHEP